MTTLLAHNWITLRFGGIFKKGTWAKHFSGFKVLQLEFPWNLRDFIIRTYCLQNAPTDLPSFTINCVIISCFCTWLSSLKHCANENLRKQLTGVVTQKVCYLNQSVNFFKFFLSQQKLKWHAFTSPRSESYSPQW